MTKDALAIADVKKIGLDGSTLVRYASERDVEAVVKAFEARTLPKREWTHQAHLTVAAWYLARYSGYEAAIRIRTGIKRYNAANGIVPTPTGGYHETMTLFWTCIVSKYLLLADRDRRFVDLVNELVDNYRDKNLPFEHYSRERLFSRQARFSWVEPDLKPIA
jgi:hypothetical protein